ncbi:hypothetical protein PTSG_09987 [Salpingoeca rosetta]|uniref:C3H1-type domain-containing protein n=1 Tax=Salpingoeca rosetta (strain ATCC 50818 / BSB-021) TaxID=946362 RepID=F2UNQ8_SALR5|nr:uncharacterized protein PTSG_09987 [Salpingoeca rosetta]EGD79263.1 hypothetical protein PTSG_09987 [Salpingoeca rosetta]|eukprot:XP_004989348.1 hypothetical protein PTSG_09987 [Salpingoeca rosetta]
MRHNGIRCKAGTKSRCTRPACGFIHTDEFDTDCKKGSECKRVDCKHIHPAPPCRNRPCKNPRQCFFRHARPQEENAFTVGRSKAMYASYIGRMALKAAVGSGFLVRVVPKETKIIVKQAPSVAADPTALKEATAKCRQFVHDHIKIEAYEIENLDRNTLKRSAAFLLAKDTRVFLFHTSTGVNIVYSSRDRMAARALPNVKALLTSLRENICSSGDHGDASPARRQRACSDASSSSRSSDMDSISSGGVAECCICFDDDVPVVGGVRCSTGDHFVCDVCFDSLVTSVATHDERMARGSDVCCPTPDCSSTPFKAKTLAMHVDDDTFQAWMKLNKDITGRNVRKEEEAARQAEEDRRARLSQMDRDAEDARKHIVENIFTLKCPRCSAAFVDFDGCFALTCAHCKCGFCAWCLTDRGNDAHPCAAQCGEKYGRGGYFGTLREFEQHHVRRRQAELDTYLGTLTPEVRGRVVTACRRDAQDLGIKLQ